MAILTSPTAQNLLSEVRIMLNAQDPTNSFWKDDELLTYLNHGVRLYFAEVILTGEGYFTTAANLNIVSDTETVALPSDFFQLKNLYKKVSNGYILLGYSNNLTTGYSTQGGTSAENFLPAYSFRGNNLLLKPIPNFSETSGLRLEYVQFPDNMVNGGDSMSNQVSPVFRELIVMYAVYKAKLRESLVNGVNTYNGAAENLQLLYKSFKDAIAQRSKNPTFIVPFNPESEA